MKDFFKYCAMLAGATAAIAVIAYAVIALMAGIAYAITM